MRKISLLILLISLFLVNQALARTYNWGIVAPEGVSGQKNLHVLQQLYQPITNYLTAQIHQPINVKIYQQNCQLVRDFVNKKIDLALVDAPLYAQVVLENKTTPILATLLVKAPGQKKLSMSYDGFIVTSRDNKNIRHIEDLRGKTMAFTTPNSLTGFIQPVIFIRVLKADYRQFFKHYQFYGNEIDLLRAIITHKADAGTIKATTLLANPKFSAYLKPIFFIRHMPNPVIIGSNNLSMAEQEGFSKLFNNLPASFFKAQLFAGFTSSYKPQLLKLVKIILKLHLVEQC